MYAICMVHLVYDRTVTEIHEKLYADDGTGAGKLIRIKELWECTKIKGPQNGYFPGQSQTKIAVKPEYFEQAETLFKAGGVIIITSGKKYLGIAMGSTEFCSEFIRQKTEKFSMVTKQAKTAEKEPQAAYTYLVFCMQSNKMQISTRKVVLPPKHHGYPR